MCYTRVLQHFACRYLSSNLSRINVLNIRFYPWHRWFPWWRLESPVTHPEGRSNHSAPIMSDCKWSHDTSSYVFIQYRCIKHNQNTTNYTTSLKFKEATTHVSMMLSKQITVAVVLHTLEILLLILQHFYDIVYVHNHNVSVVDISAIKLLARFASFRMCFLGFNYKKCTIMFLQFIL